MDQICLFMYIHENYKFNFIAPLLFLLGTIFTVYGEYITGALGFFFGILFLFSFEGVRINLEARRMQKYQKIMWIRFGKWIVVPPVQYVTVNRYNIRGSQATFLAGSDAGSSVYKSYKINLVLEGKNQYITLMRGKQEKMLKESVKIGQFLNCRVLDYSTHEKQWLL